MQGQPVTFQRSRSAPGGETRHLEFRLLPHLGEQGKVIGCFGVTIDITGHKQAQERLEQVAHHDGLTGLPNRTLFNDRLQQAIALARRDSRSFALLYLDLNRFKQVNDTQGHAAGDELLMQVAARILQQVRESDTVARIGGDEFTVILHGTGKREEAEIVCRKIVGAIEMPFRIDSNKQQASIGVSIGIALYPADAQDAEALVKAADAAMYCVKQAA
jgi:diguanylate cyclase (GGDEF)-like protein